MPLVCLCGSFPLQMKQQLLLFVHQESQQQFCVHLVADQLFYVELSIKLIKLFLSKILHQLLLWCCEESDQLIEESGFYSLDSADRVQ